MAPILDHLGRPLRAKRRELLSDRQARPRVVRVIGGGGLRASYDAAQTTDENTRHWAAADALSADAANSYSVRKRLRQRARYEVANNSYARGIVDTYANDVVGTGPRLQLLSGDPRLNSEVEREWRRWCRKVHLARKLRTLHRARAVDGEGFGLLQTNDSLDYQVKLDLRLIECDRVHSPDVMPQANNVDGVVLDADGNPASYQVLKSHPGGLEYGPSLEADSWRAEFVLHWFRRDRPEQHRGIPEITPALPLFAQLRRYTLAVL